MGFNMSNYCTGTVHVKSTTHILYKNFFYGIISFYLFYFSDIEQC